MGSAWGRQGTNRRVLGSAWGRQGPTGGSEAPPPRRRRRSNGPLLRASRRPKKALSVGKLSDLSKAGEERAVN